MAAPAVRIDPAAVAAFGRGDRKAFLTVYDACGPAIRGLAGRFFSGSFEREEAVQEIWLLAYRMSTSYVPARGELWPWLRTLAANRCKEILRARGRRPDLSATIDAGELIAVAGDPEETMRVERIRAAVATFSRGLTAEEATVFRLSLLEERGHAAVAAAANISARRCKYLRMKLLVRAAEDPTLGALLDELQNLMRPEIP